MTKTSPHFALDELDRRLIEMLRSNARMPVVRLAKALQCARSTVLARLKALEDQHIITGYTIHTELPASSPAIHAMVLISIESRHEAEVVRALSKRFEITSLYTVSGRYDLCGLISTESTQELDHVLDKVRTTKGVVDTFSTVFLSTKLQRPA